MTDVERMHSDDAEMDAALRADAEKLLGFELDPGLTLAELDRVELLGRLSAAEAERDEAEAALSAEGVPAYSYDGDEKATLLSLAGRVSVLAKWWADTIADTAELRAENTALRGKLEEAGKALEPFAEAARRFGDTIPNGEGVSIVRSGPRQGNTTVGDLRRARTTLASIREKTDV